MTTRSYSLQNVSQSARHRGNSMTGVIGGGFPATLPALTSSTGNPTTTVIEEHAVMPEPNFSATVIVYDVTGLLPVSKDLAMKYKYFKFGNPKGHRFPFFYNFNIFRDNFYSDFKLNLKA